MQQPAESSKDIFNSFLPPYSNSVGTVWKVRYTLTRLWSKTFSLILFVSCVARKKRSLCSATLWRASFWWDFSGEIPPSLSSNGYTQKEKETENERDTGEELRNGKTSQEMERNCQMKRDVETEATTTERIFRRLCLWSNRYTQNEAGQTNTTEWVWWFMADADEKRLLPPQYWAFVLPH